MSPNIFVFLYFRDRGERRGKIIFELVMYLNNQTSLFAAEEVNEATWLASAIAELGEVRGVMSYQRKNPSLKYCELRSIENLWR